MDGMAFTTPLIPERVNVCEARTNGATRRRWRLAATVVAGMLLLGGQSINMTPENVAQAYSVDFGSASTYVPLPAGSVRLSANTANSNQMLVTASAGLTPGRQYTAVVANVAASLQETIYPDQTTPAPAGDVAVRVIDAATRAGSVDLYMVPAGEKLKATSAVRAGVVFGASTGYVILPAGTYSLVVVPAGTAPTNQALPLMTAPQTAYAAGAVRTVVLVDHPNTPAQGVDEIVTSDYDPQETASKK